MNLEHWAAIYKKKPPTFDEFLRTFIIYRPKYSWQKKLPFWLLKLFVKPTIFKNCYLKDFDSLKCESGVINHSISFSFDSTKLGENK